ncbi:MAG: hypothetical protein ACLVJH_17320 [Faecalibacterium prausnitzii]
MKLYQLTTLGPVVLYKCTKTLCKQCGKPIAPDSAEGLCSVCRIKARTLKRQEEARQRRAAEGRGAPPRPPRRPPRQRKTLRRPQRKPPRPWRLPQPRPWRPLPPCRRPSPPGRALPRQT